MLLREVRDWRKHYLGNRARWDGGEQRLLWSNRCSSDIGHAVKARLNFDGLRGAGLVAAVPFGGRLEERTGGDGRGRHDQGKQRD